MPGTDQWWIAMTKHFAWRPRTDLRPAIRRMSCAKLQRTPKTMMEIDHNCPVDVVGVMSPYLAWSQETRKP